MSTKMKYLDEHDLYWFFIFTSKILKNDKDDYSLMDQKIIGIEALALDNEELIARKY